MNLAGQDFRDRRPIEAIKTSKEAITECNYALSEHSPNYANAPSYVSSKLKQKRM